MKRPITAQDHIQEANNLKDMISLCKKALALMAVIALAFVLGTLAGCATTPGNTVTPLSPSGLSEYNNHSRYDDGVIAYCESISLTVAYELVAQNPEAFTVEQVTDIVGYLYGNCIRDNGRAL